MARSKTPAWMDHLPLVLLGIRTSVRQDSDWCPAELVYGATLRLPGEFLYSPEPDSALSPSSDFVVRLRSALAAMRPSPSVHHRPGPLSGPAIPPSLVGVSHVFVRVDAVRRPLSRPYEGPFKVLQREAKTFVISRAGKSWTISVDRLKPAYGVSDALPASSSDVPVAPALSVPRPGPRPGPLAPALDPPATRSGRLSRPPSRFVA